MWEQKSQIIYWGREYDVHESNHTPNHCHDPITPSEVDLANQTTPPFTVHT